MKERLKKQYLEDRTSKDWMDRNLKPNRQSAFIRSAVMEKIERTEKEKQ